jgi:hypothetical protein
MRRQKTRLVLVDKLVLHKMVVYVIVYILFITFTTQLINDIGR